MKVSVHAKRQKQLVEVMLHSLLTSAKDGDEWSVSRPGRFTPRGEHNIYRTGDWPVGHTEIFIIIIIIIITAIGLSLGGSSPYTSTDKTNKNKYT